MISFTLSSKLLPDSVVGEIACGGVQGPMIYYSSQEDMMGNKAGPVTFLPIADIRYLTQLPTPMSTL